jgi:hypothetical protein
MLAEPRGSHYRPIVQWRSWRRVSTLESVTYLIAIIVASARSQARRIQTRRAVREWLRKLEHVEDDWEAQDLLWSCIAQWLDRDPLHLEIFLTLFRAWGRARYSRARTLQRRLRRSPHGVNPDRRDSRARTAQ